MNKRDVEMAAFRLLADHGTKAIDMVIGLCDDAAEQGAEDALAFWNEVFNLMYGWEIGEPEEPH